MMESSQSSQANQARQSTHAIEANHRSKVKRALYICTLMLGVATLVFVIADIDFQIQGQKNMINAGYTTDTTDGVVGARVLLGNLNDTCDTGTWTTRYIKDEPEALECVETKWQPRTCKLGDTKEDPSSKLWMICVRKVRQQETEWKSTQCPKAPKWNDESKNFVASEPWIEKEDGKQYRCFFVSRRWDRKIACTQGNTKKDGSTCDAKGFYGKCESGQWKEEGGDVYQCSVVPDDKLPGFSKRDWKYMWKKECDFKQSDAGTLLKMENGNCRFCVHGQLGIEKNKDSQICKK